MRIVFLLARHEPSRISPIFPEVLRRLAERGAPVQVIFPEDPDAAAPLLRYQMTFTC